MWKDFPQRLCDAAGCRGLVYSRPGYGRSTPRAAEEAWGLDFMHRQAHEVLPALLAALGIDAGTTRPGCSATATAARSRCCTRRASRSASPAPIVLAPHILVEDLSVASIAKARDGLPARPTCAQRLARYHDDPDSAFWGWNDIWLHPPFRHWSIEDEIATIALPAAGRAGRWTTSTARWSRSAASRAACRRPSCSSWPTAATRRTATSPSALIAAATAFIHTTPPTETNHEPRFAHHPASPPPPPCCASARRWRRRRPSSRSA